MYAKVILDSISPDGDRLTTMEVRMHRFVLAEFNTHRIFSRNSASSRAIPILKRIADVWNSLAWPVEWGSNKPGMQAGEELTGWNLTAVKTIWKMISVLCCGAAWLMHRLGLHKQVANRVLEPFLWHTVVVTSTEWQNYFSQRCSPLAQPEIRAVSDMMKKAYDESVPQPVDTFGSRGWHLPYLTDTERQDLAAYGDTDGLLSNMVMCSVARCARVSYKSYSYRESVKGRREEISLFKKLATAEPPHLSPMEHVAIPFVFNETGNFKGWKQLRHMNFKGLLNRQFSSSRESQLFLSGRC